jgi:hypothetical protein
MWENQAADPAQKFLGALDRNVVKPNRMSNFPYMGTRAPSLVLDRLRETRDGLWHVPILGTVVCYWHLARKTPGAIRESQA